MPTSRIEIPIRSDKLSMNVRVTEHVLHRKTEYQTIDIYETDALGRVLLLDGHVQLSQLDEHAYHEALVHVPMINISSPKKALVIGGGDGGVIRELCKHKTLEQIDMVEIDQGVVDACKEEMPYVSDGAFDHPKVRVFIEDAFGFVRESGDSYDLIVADSTDVYEEEDGGLSEQLFTETFYKDCFRILSPGGMIVTQADNLLFCPYSLKHIQNMFDKVFTKTGSYFAIVPSFGGFSGFCWGSKGAMVSENYAETRQPDFNLRYLNRQSYEFGMAALPY